MSSNFLEIFKAERKAVSPVTDPFKKKCIDSIHLHALKRTFSDDISVSGSVKFINNNTKGEQEFEAATLDELLYKIKTFVEKL